MESRANRLLILDILLLRCHPYALLGSVIAGFAIVNFEIVEVLVIWSPPGLARNLQIFYFTPGFLILVLSIPQWIIERKAPHRR